jgi:hypothetical protein
MKVRHLLLASMVLVLAAGIVLSAEAQDVRLNVTRSDDYVTRRMVIFKKSGEQVGSLVKIRSFDPASASFVMEGVAGEAVTLAASDIKQIVFEQTVARQSPMAQQAYWEITESFGPGLRYKVKQNSLRVVSGDLVLPVSSPVVDIPAPPVPPLPPLSTNGSSTTSATITEARRLAYDAPSKTFAVEVQNVTYNKEMSGSSGISGVRK